MNADGTGQAALIAQSTTVESNAWGWMPDSSRLVVTETTMSGAFPIVLTLNDGSTRTAIYSDATETNLGDWAACVDPGGSAYFFGDDTPNTAIGKITIPGGVESTLLTPTGNFSFWPFYCTPGGLVMFTDNGPSAGHFDIRTCALDGSGETIVVPGGTAGWNSVTATPDWT
jgi:hypothetical protein